MLERRTKAGNPWARVGVEAQSHKVTWARSNLGRSLKSSYSLLTVRGSANSSFAFRFFSVFIVLQSLDLPLLAFSSPNCKGLAFQVSPCSGDALPLYVGQQLPALVNQHFL